ncbi:MAG: hypothetical protein COA60_005850 [Robiginitomaculum sp.]|nr:hypothetical protein [Robiginitomaculum sp.]
MEAILIPISLFAIVPVIVLIVSLNGRKRNADLQETVQKAIEKGVELTPESIRALGVKPRSQYSDLRSGVICVAIALAFIILGASIEQMAGENVLPVMIGIAAFPGLVGLALIAMHFLLHDKK